MSRGEVIGLPGGDHPRQVGQGHAPREIVVGPTSIGERITVLGQHVDGLLVVHDILDRGEGPVEVGA